MHKKTASLWRYLRTPLLLTSVTAFVIGCASKNPLIDEADSSETSQSVSIKKETRPIQKEDRTIPSLTGNTDQDTAKITSEQEISRSEDELNTKPTGMKKWLGMFAPYKINIQQGNFISSEMLAKVQPGMTKEQIRFVLGTPLLTDMFHAGRWDYVFRLQKPNGATTTNRVTVFFSGNLVDHLISDKLPDEAEYLSHITSDDEPTEKTRKEKGHTDSDTANTFDTETPERSSSQENPDASLAETESLATVTAPSGNAASDTPSDRAISSTHTAEPANTPETSREATTAHVPETTETRPVRTTRIPKPSSTPESIAIPAKTVRSPATVQNAGAIRSPEPVSTPEPVSAPIPEMTDDLATNRPKRPTRREILQRTIQVDTDDSENTSSGNISTFEPISTPSRIGKMLPASPNDELIGNIQ